MRGSGGLDKVRGDQGGGRCWRRKREMAEVVMTRGIVAASVCNVSRNFKHWLRYDYKMNAFTIGKANKVRACWYESIGPRTST